jgi:TetR/AcrR family transcriptional regulator, ethionamide resistance regulator
MVEAAERLLAGGATYAELTIEQIAREAGQSRTSFYFLFRDKSALLEAAAADLADFVAGAGERWLADARGGRRELREALLVLARGFVEHAPLLRAVVEASAYDAAVGDFWSGLIERYVDATSRRLRDSGTAKGERAEILAAALVWMTERTLYQLVVGDDRRDPERVVAVLADIWWQALSPAPTRHRV